MNNLEIARLLRAVAAAYIIKGENRFRIIAYERAADSIEHATSELKDLWDDDRLGEIPGIGPAIQGHLNEIFKTGRSSYFIQVMKDLPASMFPLLSVPGFGPKKAFKLVKTLKLTNEKTIIEDLEKAASQGKIAPIPGFGEKSEKDILEAILNFKKGSIKEKRMLLPFALTIAQEVSRYLEGCSAVERFDFLGSLRRMVSTIGDIDIAVATKKPSEVVKYFTSYPKKQKVIEKGPTGASLLLNNGRQVDLRVLKPQAYGSMLQYFTGSKNHNIHLRELALKKNLSLSEYGIKTITNSKKQIVKIREFSSEEEFYQALGLAWIPPELREDTGEIEAALRQAQGERNGLPKLVNSEEIKGDLHLHSDYPIEPSHDLGSNSMEEMLNKARSLGYEYIAFSEHSPSIANHTNEEIYNILKRRRNKIEQLKLSSKDVRIINLLEVDILCDGSLSIDDNGLDFLEAAIASIHSSFNQPKEKMTARILKAIANPRVKILGHPTGRLLNEREGYEADWEKIFQFCRQNNKALEISSWPDRLDLPDVLVRLAVKMQVKMVVSTDAHATEEMDLMKFGISVARRGWAKASDILNTLGYNHFYAWIKERR
jgi:DNA polymerase (family 10)